MTKDILFQLNQANLLPHISESLLTGPPPTLPELVMHLLITVMDAHFMTTGDPKSTWNERRLSHQNLANGFMLVYCPTNRWTYNWFESIISHAPRYAPTRLV